MVTPAALPTLQMLVVDLAHHVVLHLVLQLPSADTSLKVVAALVITAASYTNYLMAVHKLLGKVLDYKHTFHPFPPENLLI